MDVSTYQIEAEVEKNHWWFVGRRKLLKSLINELNIPVETRILDLGTSTGTNLRLLRDMGFVNYIGLDSSDEAIRWCKEKELGNVQKGDICSLPFKNNEFSLVLATDVIEHVKDDLLALSEINRVLNKNGIVIITVPAFQILWGRQDEVAHHKRRYLINDLKQKLIQTGFINSETFYFNYLMFLPIWLVRTFIRLLHVNLVSENQLNTTLFNYMLTHVFLVDVWSARKLKPPFGVSICAVVRPDKPEK